jgi:hypothetical protein
MVSDSGARGFVDNLISFVNDALLSAVLSRYGVDLRVPGDDDEVLAAYEAFTEQTGKHPADLEKDIRQLLLGK